MPIKHPHLKLTRLTDAIPAWTGDIVPDDLFAICQQVHDGGGRLVALWGSDARQQNRGFMLHVVLVNETGMVCLNVQLSAEQPVYPDISRIFPAANRMQRAAYDMLGIYAHEGHDHRKWLRHAAWHSGSFPLRKDFDGSSHRNAPHLNPLDETTSHSTRPQTTAAKSLVIPLAGEGIEESASQMLAMSKEF